MDKESLALLYSTFTDEALIGAAAAGPDSYRPEAWQVIQELLASRGLSTGLSAPEPIVEPQQAAPSTAAPTPAAEPPEVATERVSTHTTSRYFLWSRFVQGARWPPDRLLPLSGRDFLAVPALLFGVIGTLSLFLHIIVGVPPPAGINLPVFGLVAAFSLVFGVSANHPPSPRTWDLAMLYSGIMPFLANLMWLDRETIPFSALEAASTLTSALAWLLYFARRRATYGLTPWPAVL